MSEYRNRTTGEVKSQREWKLYHKNVSLPQVWNDDVLEALELDPVFAGERPAVTGYKVVVRDGEVQNDSGDWVENWVAQDMFSDGEDGTKAEKEAAYQEAQDAEAAKINRSVRDAKLAETDYLALSDNTMSAEMTTYRQALRDITNHANWPNLEDADWPTKP